MYLKEVKWPFFLLLFYTQNIILDLFVLFYVYKHFACLYVCAPCAWCLVPVEVKRSLGSLEV